MICWGRWFGSANNQNERQDMQANWIPRINRFTAQEREARKLADIAKRRESRAHWQRLAGMLADIHAEIAPLRPVEIGDEYETRERLQWKYLSPYGVAL